jgi:hypothetical protein
MAGWLKEAVGAERFFRQWPVSEAVWDYREFVERVSEI